MSVFWKYHGLGNDFVMVDRRGQGDIPADRTRAVCHRHTGVGADGILGLYDDGGVPRMRVFNADGSIADMCGNGLRCFVRWLVDDLGWPAEPLTVMTDAGPQQCEPVTEGGRVTAVRVNLGRPRFAGEVTLQVGGVEYVGQDLFLGNPHFVIPRAPDALADEAAVNGPGLSTHPHFARGANIEWLQVTSRQSADLVVYERGVGLTQACGTGGGGAACTGVRLGLLDADADLSLRLPGGLLRYRVASDFRECWMTGPAEPVYRGELTNLAL